LHDIVQRELAPLYGKRHSNIARLFGYTTHEMGFTPVHFVFEFVSNEPVLDMLKTEEQRRLFTANRRVKVMYELARALAFLHKGVVGRDNTTMTYVHRDIHLANVFFAPDNTVKLMDCGLGKFFQEPSLDDTPSKITMTTMNPNNRFGSPGYICPSYLNGKIPYMPACDLYSFGIVMLELLSGCIQEGSLIQTFHEKSLLFTEFDRLAGEGWNHCLADLSTLALDCVKTEYSDRPTTEDVFDRLSDIYTRLVLTPASSPVK
jgi:serine/threonine protein kinase